MFHESNSFHYYKWFGTVVPSQRIYTLLQCMFARWRGRHQRFQYSVSIATNDRQKCWQTFVFDNVIHIEIQIQPFHVRVPTFIVNVWTCTANQSSHFADASTRRLRESEARTHFHQNFASVCGFCYFRYFRPTLTMFREDIPRSSPFYVMYWTHT